MIPNGILNINKPPNISSFAVVKKIRKVSGFRKVGHAGTLDPIATGVLVILLGEATKIVPYLINADKEYIAIAALGKTTDTLDRTGKILTANNVEDISDEKLAEVLKKNRGEIEHIPPMYSALHYKGERLYNLARQQKEIVLPARKVNIKKLVLLERDSQRMKFHIECSKGTYIRTLCHNIGNDLGCGAYLEELTRIRSGDFRLENSIELAKFNQPENILENLISIDKALPELQTITIKPEKEILVKHGVPLNQSSVEENIDNINCDIMVKIFSFTKVLLALGQKDVYNKKILIKRVFNI